MWVIISKMIIDKRLKNVYKEGNVALYEYRPSLLCPLYGKIDSLTFVRRVRLTLEYLRRRSYKVYYLAVDGKLVGYDVITPGGRRLKFSTSLDVVTGPIFIKPEHRGKGYGKTLLRLAMKMCKGQAERVLCWIQRGNAASIKTHEVVGFMPIGSLDVVGKRRNLVEYNEIDRGKYLVYVLSFNEPIVPINI